MENICTPHSTVVIFMVWNIISLRECLHENQNKTYLKWFYHEKNSVYNTFHCEQNKI